MSIPYHIKTIADYHKLTGLPKPEHPLISVIRFEDVKAYSIDFPKCISHHFYSIAVKKDFNAKMRYGQQEFDFDAGVMHFMSPKQVLSLELHSEEELKHSGWLLLIHPDFFWNTSLSQKIKQYEYFGCNVNEALHLSDKDEVVITDIIKSIALEYHNNIDNLSHIVIIAQLELLLTYSERFYQRQFITRRKANHQILNQFEQLLNKYFNDEELTSKGLPTVEYFAAELHLSSNYLSRLLKTLTGETTKQFLQDKVIVLAKEKLSTTTLSINEIAYGLGFEHPQSFSKLFKIKTNFSPLEFRQSFN